MKRLRFLLLWRIATSRCNLYSRENLSLPCFPQNGCYALLKFSADEYSRRKLLEIQMQKFLWAKLLNRMRMSCRNMQFLLRHQYTRFVFPPLSLMPFPKDYENRVCQAVSGASPDALFLNMYGHLVKGHTNKWACDIDTVLQQITHQNGKFEAIKTYGRVLMGRANCPLGLKMVVVKSPLFPREKVTVILFHPIAQMLICGHEDGTVKFLTFTDDSQSATPSFVMILVASQSCVVRSSVKRITSNDSGSIFVVEYESSPSVLVSMDTMMPFVPEYLRDRIGNISALAFFGSRILTTHYNQYCVWNIDESDGFLTLVSQIDPIINSRGYCPGGVFQIIHFGEMSFLFRTSESIFLVRLREDFTRCDVVHEQPVYDRFQSFRGKDLEFPSMALNGRILTVVVPTRNILKIFLVDESGISLFKQTSVEEPTSWAYNPRTSVFSYYYDSCTFTRFRRIGF